MGFEKRFRLRKFLDFLGEGISMDTLSQRVEFQKMTYLLQAFDVDIWYPFNWYLHGPYSTQLADDGFALASMDSSKLDKLAEPYSIEENRENLERMREFLQHLRGITPGLKDYERFELAASLHFLARRTLRDRGNCKEIVERLRQRKPEFRLEQATRVCRLMSEVGLIRP